MACLISAALTGADPLQLPLQGGYSDLPGFPIRLKNLKLIKRIVQRRGIGMLLYQFSSLRSQPIVTDASILLLSQFDLYLPAALRNPQRHHVAK